MSASLYKRGHKQHASSSHDAGLVDMQVHKTAHKLESVAPELTSTDRADQVVKHADLVDFCIVNKGIEPYRDQVVALVHLQRTEKWSSRHAWHQLWT